LAAKGGVMFYVIEYENKDAFLISDDDGAPEAFSTEVDAIAKAKEFCGTALILKAVARVTKKTTHKVEKIK
jgi:hypothetical protein